MIYPALLVKNNPTKAMEESHFEVTNFSAYLVFTQKNQAAMVNINNLNVVPYFDT